MFKTLFKRPLKQYNVICLIQFDGEPLKEQEIKGVVASSRRNALKKIKKNITITPKRAWLTKTKKR